MNLVDLLHTLRKRWLLVAALPLACALATAAFCWLVLPNQYATELSLYVLTGSTASEDEVTNADLTASQMLTNDVAKIVGGPQASERAAQAVGAESLNAYDVSVSSDTSTRVIVLSVSGPSSDGVVIVANTLAAEADNVARSVMDVKNVSIVEPARVPTVPSGPPRALYTAAAFALGLLAAIAVSIVLELADTRVRNGEEAAEALGIPVIGRMPEFKE